MTDLLSIDAGGMDGHVSTKRKFQTYRGFTLIELLVVISIIALLLSLLLPALSKVRETGQAIKCASHMRSLGQANWTYAGDQKGRAPGDATLQCNRPNWAAYRWNNILNHEVFGDPYECPWDYYQAQRNTIRWFNSGSIPLDEDKIWCPTLWHENDIPAAHQRAFPQNAAVGGYQIYGTLRLPKITASMSDPYYKTYNLGALFDVFEDHSYTFMHIEGERANDYAGYQNPSGLVMADYPPNTANSSGQNNYPLWAFRHNGSANELFIDGHVKRFQYASRQDYLNTRQRLEGGARY